MSPAGRAGTGLRWPSTSRERQLCARDTSAAQDLFKPISCPGPGPRHRGARGEPAGNRQKACIRVGGGARALGPPGKTAPWGHPRLSQAEPHADHTSSRPVNKTGSIVLGTEGCVGVCQMEVLSLELPGGRGAAGAERGGFGRCGRPRPEGTGGGAVGGGAGSGTASRTDGQASDRPRGRGAPGGLQRGPQRLVLVPQETGVAEELLLTVVRPGLPTLADLYVLPPPPPPKQSLAWDQVAAAAPLQAGDS